LLPPLQGETARYAGPFGLDVDATKNAPGADDTEIGINEIQVVSRSVENAKELATEATEFSNE
jgi:hypothetical protein